MQSGEKSGIGPGEAFFVIFKGVLVGFALGLILAVSAASFVWLEMRVNVGLVIPAAAILCPVFALWKGKVLSYSLFLAGQVVLLIVLAAVHGFDVGALWSVPAYLFREGFHGGGLELKTAGLMLGGILLGGNLWWIAFLKMRRRNRNHS